MTSHHRNNASREEWEILRRQLTLDASPWLRVWREDVLLPDGREVDGFLGIEMRDYVVVVAITMENRVVTERGYKHGPRRVCLSLPAGYIEQGESPDDAVRRELREETGFVANRWEPLGSFTNDGNRGGGRGHLFLARDARQVAEPDSGDLESVTIELLTFDELMAAVRSGAIAVMANATAIALAMLQLGNAW